MSFEEPNWRIFPNKLLSLKASDIAELVKASRASKPTIISNKTFKDALADAGENLPSVLMETGQYQGKSFFWILTNDPGYVTYLARAYETKEVGQVSKESELFCYHLSHYALTFQVFKDTFNMTKLEKVAKTEAEELSDDGLLRIGFGPFANLRYNELFPSLDLEHREYVRILINKKDVHANTRMDKLRKWLISQKSESAVDDLMTTLPDELLTQNIPSCPSMDDVLSSSSPAH